MGQRPEFHAANKHLSQCQVVLGNTWIMLRRALVLLLVTLPAFAQDTRDPSVRYAVEPDLATAQALSAAAWAAVRCAPQPDCDKAQVTKFVYPVIGLSDLTRYAIVIHTGDVYQGEHLSLPNGKSFDLTAGQIASLQTRAQVGTLLPDVLQVALVNSRVLPAESTAINTYKAGHASFATNYNSLISGPIDLLNPLTNTVFNELISAGVLTAARAQVILAPQSVSVVTQSVAP